MDKSKIKILPKPTSPSTGGVKKAGTTGNDARKRRGSSTARQSGHRPVTSCTFCRQHKIKCNANENYPNPCIRCHRLNLKCEIDPEFRPKKGSQILSLKSDVDELKSKIELLSKNEHLLTQALSQHNLLQQKGGVIGANGQPDGFTAHRDLNSLESTPNFSPINDALESNLHPIQLVLKENSDNSPRDSLGSNYKKMDEFVLGDVKLTLDKANELHDNFMKRNLPFLPIISSRSATELYHRSQLLFWTVILTASLHEPEPTLYMTLASLIKQLAIETCWLKTPRSTHVIQALLILAIWPLPNEKVLDDCSYRFIGLAKNLALQLGLHRGGGFIKEFTRTQVPDAETWRTRSWLAIFFCEQFWSSVLGLPPSINSTDYLLENARIDQSLPKDFRCLISLSIFQSKLINVMGVSVTRPDGLLEPSNRAASLNILDRELERLKFKLDIVEGSGIEMYHLYIKLMICCFSFLPGTPIEDQVKYVSSAYLSATRIITIASKLIGDQMALIELPIYMRQAITYSVLMLFRLHLSRYLLDKYVDSARQSIVTVHRLLRNTISSWKDLKNDISRTAKALENLNIVIYTYPDIFLNDEMEGSIITRMRSHLTASLFYDLIWCVHEGRRRTLLDKGEPPQPVNGLTRKIAPLPFYNQITKDDFKTLMSTTPNGTTITTLVPTDRAMTAARNNAGENEPLEINGIPLSMLEATGSIKDTFKFENPSEILDQQKPDPSIAQATPLPPQSFIDLFPRPIAPQGLIESDVLPMQQEQLQQQQPSNVIDQFGVSQQLDNFFQQQSNGWLNNNDNEDDFLGWFDVNVISNSEQ
jgi:hypothetical protein